MRNRNQIASEQRCSSNPGSRRQVVVVDDGITAALVILGGSGSATPGARFRHSGREWEIRGPRHGSGVLVAAPVEAPRQQVHR
jgi:hypothetical protein